MSTKYGDQGLTHQSPGYLHRKFVLNPITALAFYTSRCNGRVYLLAGEDNHLKLYDVDSSSLCGELPVFRAQSIHGITVTAEKAACQQQAVVIWGGHSVAVLSGKIIEGLIGSDSSVLPESRRIVKAKAPDWILDGISCPYPNCDLAFLTAHNEVIHAKFDEEAGDIHFDELYSPSRPILYSGNLSWIEKDCILVAAGTCFGEILVWKCHLGMQCRESKCEVLHIFTGHEGSIFGIHISPEYQLESGRKLRLIASCSDDRTIRVWNITETPDTSRHLCEDDITVARETGFGGSAKTTTEAPDSTGCLAVIMGHVSRIWQVEFSSRATKMVYGNIELWSFGEDATAQKWMLSLGGMLASSSMTNEVSPELSSHLEHLATFSPHSGKHIWSHAMTHLGNNGVLIATGGSDGRISLIDDGHVAAAICISDGLPEADIDFCENNIQKEPQLNAPTGEETLPVMTRAASLDSSSEFVSDTTPEPSEKTAKKKKKKKKPNKLAKETVQRYAFVAGSRFLAVTNHGRALVGNFEPHFSWEELALSKEIRAKLVGYSVVVSSHTGAEGFVGAADGEIFIYRSSQPGTLESLVKVPGKIADMFSLSPQNSGGTGHQLSGSGLLLVTILGSPMAPLFRIDEDLTTEQMVVNLSKGFVVTSAALCRGFLLLGSRNGLLTILESSDDGTYITRLTIEAKMDETVTSISALPGQDEDPMAYFLTTNRDGKYRIYSLLAADNNIKVTLLNETSPPLGPMIEGSCLSVGSRGGKDLILSGFQSKAFIIWNETQRREIARIDCGGGHRTFAYTLLPKQPDGFRFAFTKASRLFVVSQMQASHRTLRTGGHGRELRALSWSGNYLATAAEDTTIRIWDYDAHSGAAHDSLHCLTVLEKHATGIQTLRWYKQSHLFSSAGNEEFFVWRVSELKSDLKALPVTCEAVFPDKTADGDLRIIDFDVECLEETSDGELVFYISMAFSDSVVRSYTYSKVKGFKLIARGDYTGACLMQLRHLHAKDGIIRLLTAATDGHLNIWQNRKNDKMDQYEITASARVHQNAIKSMDIQQISTENGSSLLVVTGGDDNALGVAVSRGQASDEWRVMSKSIVRSAHTAAITGVAILRAEADGSEAIVVSCSNDQRVKKWRLLGWDSSHMRVELMTDEYSSVADAGDIEVLDGGEEVMVAGVGLEIWDV